ncbi:hypothetical protein ACIP28_29735 [Streptomyces albidoflavus]|uniref:hypothetical protein n=1 Tax=Streptomyces sp. S5 TaxID=1456735 RepID=UPI000CB031EB|nr:hypothetical protein [Streptomyces sp. S5]MBO1286107.1 hypothetical protein [Streptomyces sampsonii]PJT45581.1 hypothetical protein CWI85_37960 [Streptomyces albidoflavus]
MLDVGVGADRPDAGGMSPAQRVLADWLGMQIAAADQCAHQGTEGWAHRSVYELVAAHGRWFAPSADLPAGIRPMSEKECFANAAATERKHPHLVYTEGFAVAAGSPVGVAHAWCTDSEGRVVDPTWSDLGGSAYLGIVLPPDTRPQRHRAWGVLESPETLFPLLRNGLPSGR